VVIHLAAIGGLLLSLVTACTPAVKGMAGVALDGHGSPVAVLEGCGGTVSTVRLRYSDVNRSSEPDVGEWRFSGGEGNKSLNLAQPGVSWRASRPFSALSEGVSYQLLGWIGAGSDAVTLTPVDFTLKELRALGPGKLLIYANQPGVARTIITTSEFAQVACE
jgi:hypothetical protein